MHFTTKGIVLREVNYKEADKILTLLTTQGKMTCKAPGCRRKGSKLTASSQLLTYSEFVLYDYNEMLRVSEAEPLEHFMATKEDLEKLSLGSYFAEVTETVAEEGREDEGLLPLILNSLYALGKLNKPQELVKAAFELRLLSLSGFEPMLDGCAICGRDEPVHARLAINEGILRCEECKPEDEIGIAIPVSETVLQAMRYIVSCDSKKIFSFHLNEQDLKKLGDVTEAYLMAQLERGFGTLDFYKSLKR